MRALLGLPQPGSPQRGLRADRGTPMRADRGTPTPAWRSQRRIIRPVVRSRYVLILEHLVTCAALQPVGRPKWGAKVLVHCAEDLCSLLQLAHGLECRAHDQNFDEDQKVVPTGYESYHFPIPLRVY
eukprot:1195216-Prorocentrum_minimum.AAC.1